MKKYIIEFSSITYALKAKTLLENRGIFAKISKKSNLNQTGCGYVLVANCDIDKVIIAFDMNKIKYVNYELIQ